eukprot:TRINITY_DN12201_c0_g1::TRINITY_DN12201_c0_g1_i1::g.26508::m.26508 TRINITY_DN12201_c0_g1::TRINITY_DN12201_c0_g1_i1::g.26508  ORF type:complete len:214 (+),score=12.76 TRINITY_DN12201_c0_g1_i1:93-734(+)
MSCSDGLLFSPERNPRSESAPGSGKGTVPGSRSLESESPYKFLGSPFGLKFGQWMERDLTEANPKTTYLPAEMDDMGDKPRGSKRNLMNLFEEGKNPSMYSDPGRPAFDELGYVDPTHPQKSLASSMDSSMKSTDQSMTDLAEDNDSGEITQGEVGGGLASGSDDSDTYDSNLLDLEEDPECDELSASKGLLGRDADEGEHMQKLKFFAHLAV